MSFVTVFHRNKNKEGLMVSGHKFVLVALLAGSLVACAPHYEQTEKRLVREVAPSSDTWPSLTDVPERPKGIATYQEQQDLFDRLEKDQKASGQPRVSSSNEPKEIETPVVPDKEPTEPSHIK